MDVSLLLHSPSETSLLSVWATAPPSATLPPLLDCSDEESVTESHREGAGGRGGGGAGGGNYKGWLGTNLPSIQFSPQPAGGGTISTESSAANTEEDVAEEVGSRDMYLLKLTSSACRRQEKELQQEEQEHEEKEKPPSAPLEVNLLTLTFGTQGKPNEKEEEEQEEEESPPLSELTGGAEGAEQQTEEGGEEEEEEEELDYISRSYFSRQN